MSIVEDTLYQASSSEEEEEEEGELFEEGELLEEETEVNPEKRRKCEELEISVLDHSRTIKKKPQFWGNTGLLVRTPTIFLLRTHQEADAKRMFSHHPSFDAKYNVRYFLHRQLNVEEIPEDTIQCVFDKMNQLDPQAITQTFDHWCTFYHRRVRNGPVFVWGFPLDINETIYEPIFNAFKCKGATILRQTTSLQELALSVADQ